MLNPHYNLLLSYSMQRCYIMDPWLPMVGKNRGVRMTATTTALSDEPNNADLFKKSLWQVNHQ